MLWAMLAALSGSLLAAAPGHALEGRVVSVSDGDSLWVKPAAGGRSLRVRIQGIDAPERCQAGGAEARKALEGLVKHRNVTLLERGHDDHGRVLARLAVSGHADVGAAMVAAGHAWSYRYRDDPGPYVAEEKRAAKARRGLHRAAGAELPRAFRLRHGPCR